MTYLPWRRRARSDDLDAALEASYRHVVHACQPATSEQIGRELSAVQALTMRPRPPAREFRAARWLVGCRQAIGDRLLDLLDSLDNAVYRLLDISVRMAIPAVTGAVVALTTGLATWAAGVSATRILIATAITFVAAAGVMGVVRARANSARAKKAQAFREQAFAEVIRTHLQELGPDENQVFQVGSLLVVKVDRVVNVFRLTAAQQAELAQQFQLNRSPREITTALNLAIVNQDESLQNWQ